MRHRLSRAARRLFGARAGAGAGGPGERFRKRPLLEALEQRMLLSADALTLGEVTGGLEAVTVGLLSGDVWPDRIIGLSVSLLKSPNMRWLQSFSAGIDNPFFTQILNRGVRLTTASGTSASPIAQTVVSGIPTLAPIAAGTA